MRARSAGFRNYQHLRASNASKPRLNIVESGAGFRRVERTLQQFNKQGILLRWPSKRHVQELCIWGLWSLFPPTEALHERNPLSGSQFCRCRDSQAQLGWDEVDHPQPRWL